MPAPPAGGDANLGGEAAKTQNSPGSTGCEDRRRAFTEPPAPKGGTEGLDLWGLGMWFPQRWGYASFGDGLGVLVC